MIVHYVAADLELSARAMEPEDRLERIRKAVVSLPCTLILFHLKERRLGSIEALFVIIGGLRSRS